MPKKVDFISELKELNFNVDTIKIDGEELKYNSNIEIYCNEGHLNKSTLRSIRKRKICNRCSKLTSYFKAINILKSEGYIIITQEDDYIDTVKTKIEYECTNGHVHSTSVSHIFSGRRCKKCANDELSYNKRLTMNQVYATFANENYKLINIISDYKNEDSRVTIKCPNNHIYDTAVGNFRRGFRCNICSYDSITGENNHRWKGGITELRDYMRKKLNNWKIESLKSTNYKCFVTGLIGKLEIHHNTNFSDILDETLIELDIKEYKSVSEYTITELESIEKIMMEKHSFYGLGTPLLKDVHKLFHKIYGRSKNNINQVIEFKKDYLEGKYNDVKGT